MSADPTLSPPAARHEQPRVGDRANPTLSKLSTRGPRARSVGAFQASPSSGFVFFIGLSLTTRNANLPRFIRFNVQQALLLDIVLIIPTLFADFGAPPLPQQLSVVGSNCVFYAWLLVVTYSWACNLQGKTPDQVPLLSDAASMQIGP